MNDIIKITEIDEHEDGSATLQLECDPETYKAIFNVGFVSLVQAGLDAEWDKSGSDQWRIKTTEV